MARQVLDNGVILPSEYSDDWYDDMTSNLTKLDDVIGSDSEKLSSADVGAAALSNSYNDLDNLPTIPTKTSDLTNDSNFVDTSNSAVASGITSAKVTDYDTHIADTDIHVTTADKTKWNNGVTQSYVLRYSSTAITDNSTIAYSTLDNTDNIKVSDKIIDTDGKIFSIVSVDSDNSTVTVGSALIDLALDANVVHTNEINSSGIGIIGSVKEVGGVNFNTLTTQGLYGTNASGSTNNPEDSPCVVQVIKRLNSVIQIANVSSSAYKSRYIRYCADITAQPPVWQSWVKFATDDNVMHLSGNETVAGQKTFNDLQIIGYGTQYEGARNAYILPEFSAGYSGLSITTLGYAQTLKIGNFVLDANNRPTLDSSKGYIQFAIGENNSVNTSILEPRNSTNSSLGTSSYKWKEINGLTPSSLSLPSNTYIDISGYVTDFSGGSNQYIAPDNGFISLDISGTNRYVLYNNTLSTGERLTGSNFRRASTLQVRKNDVIIIQLDGGTLNYAKFYPCQGNI